MRAVVQVGYGSPAMLQLRNVDRPKPGPGEVLVETRAASVNALDWHTTRGMPYLIRVLDGVRVPRQQIRGVDLAGRVAAVGPNVAGLEVGDEVFGGGKGSFAEYVLTTPDRLAIRPAAVPHEQAATLYIAALTALQGLRDKARLREGQRVLIDGAGGGVGTFAVQIAKWLGAHVTAVTRQQSADVVRTLGADEVVDRCAEDVTRRGDRHDVLFDIAGHRPFRDYRRVLTKRAIVVAVGAPAGRWLAPATRLLSAAALTSFVSQRIVPFISANSAEDLALLADLAEAGKIRPVIDRAYSLDETAEAVRHVGEGWATGKIVIRTQAFDRSADTARPPRDEGMAPASRSI